MYQTRTNTYIYRNYLNNSSNRTFTQRVLTHQQNKKPTNTVQIDLGRMKRTGKAGKGTYGVVYIAETLDDKQQYVVKRNIINSSTDFLGSLKELDLLIQLKGHPYIVSLESISFGNPFTGQRISPINDPGFKEDLIYFIFEKAICDGHSLIYNNTPISIMKYCMVQLLLAVEYIHSKNFIHRDIKPANLLWFEYNNSYTIKLCDFGLSKPFTNQGIQTPGVVTSWYRAPEICLAWPHYTTKSDLWSVGCVFYEMVTKRSFVQLKNDHDLNIFNRILNIIPELVTYDTLRKLFQYLNDPLPTLPFRHRRTMEKSLNLTNKQLNEFNKEYVNDILNPGSFLDFVDLMKHLLTLDPDQRYSATEALNHPFFNGYRIFIDNTRQKFPPISNPPIPIKIYACQERKWIMDIAHSIFKGRNMLPWYTHRILFQAIDLFDRYLEHKKPTLNEFNHFDTELYFMVCLYIAIKYFTTLNVPSSFIELVTDTYKTSLALSKAKYFEMDLIKNILNLSIYRETVYEIPDQFHHYLTDEMVEKLLLYYSSLDSISGLTPRELYKFYLAKSGIPVSPVRIHLNTTHKIPTLSEYTRLSKLDSEAKIMTYNIVPPSSTTCRLKILNRVDYYQPIKTSIPPVTNPLN